MLIFVGAVNYHAFKKREWLALATGTRSALAGHGEGPATEETEGQMLQRVMSSLMGLGPIVVLNDDGRRRAGRPTQGLP